MIGRGASETKAHHYMGSSGRISDKVSVASEYLRKEGIRFRITEKVVPSCWMDTRSFNGRTRCRKEIMRSPRKDSAAAGGKGRKGSMEKNKVQEGSRHCQLGWLSNAFASHTKIVVTREKNSERMKSDGTMYR